MINKLQLDYKPVQLILAVNYEYIISDCDPEVWNVNTLTDNFYSWAYETGDLYSNDECNLSLLYHQIYSPNSLCNCSSVSNLFWYTNSNFKLLKFASATALS